MAESGFIFLLLHVVAAVVVASSTSIANGVVAAASPSTCPFVSFLSITGVVIGRRYHEGHPHYRRVIA